MRVTTLHIALLAPFPPAKGMIVMPVKREARQRRRTDSHSSFGSQIM